MSIILSDPEIQQFLAGKSYQTLNLYNHFINEFSSLGDISIEATKTMIGISNGKKRIAWITQLGRNFIHVVLPFKQAYEDNLCFVKVAQVSGSGQFNHHLRILSEDDINEEVKSYLIMALEKDYTGLKP